MDISKDVAVVSIIICTQVEFGPKYIFLLQLSSLYLISYCFTRISSSVCSFYSVIFSYLVSVIPALDRCFNFIHKIRITLQGTSRPWCN